MTASSESVSTGHAAAALETAPSHTRAGRRRWLEVAVWLVGAAALFACYLRLAGTRAVNSDGASQALQAWDMLHGNLLLRGWGLTDVSFYTTELPQYMLVDYEGGKVRQAVGDRSIEDVAPTELLILQPDGSVVVRNSALDMVDKEREDRQKKWEGRGRLDFYSILQDRGIQDDLSQEREQIFLPGSQRR